MSGSPRKPSKTSKRAPAKAKRTSTGLDRPFDQAVLARAAELARSYTVRFAPCPEGGVEGSCVELPYAAGQGDTIQSCYHELFEIMVTTLAVMIEEGQSVPSPLSVQRRDAQVNLRLSQDEKLRLEETATREGYRSVSDFIRAAALRAAS